MSCSCQYKGFKRVSLKKKSVKKQKTMLRVSKKLFKQTKVRFYFSNYLSLWLKTAFNLRHKDCFANFITGFNLILFCFCFTKVYLKVKKWKVINKTIS